MNRFARGFLLVLAPLLLTGCGLQSSMLIGKWELDKEAMFQKIDEDAKGDPGRQIAAGFAKGMLENMQATMEFQADGKFVVNVSGFMGSSFTSEGTWRTVSTSANQITIATRIDDKEEKEGTVAIIDPNTIETVPPSDKPLDNEVRFRRVVK